MAHDFAAFRHSPDLAAGVLNISPDAPEQLVRERFVCVYTEMCGVSGLESEFGTQRLENAVYDFRTRRSVADFVARYCELHASADALTTAPS